MTPPQSYKSEAQQGIISPIGKKGDVSASKPGELQWLYLTEFQLRLRLFFAVCILRLIIGKF